MKSPLHAETEPAAKRCGAAECVGITVFLSKSHESYEYDGTFPTTCEHFKWNDYEHMKIFSLPPSITFGND